MSVGSGMSQGLIAGEMVMFSKFAGSDCYFNEEAFRIMDAKEVLCVLEEDPETASGDVLMPVVI